MKIMLNHNCFDRAKANNSGTMNMDGLKRCTYAMYGTVLNTWFVCLVGLLVSWFHVMSVFHLAGFAWQ